MPEHIKDNRNIMMAVLLAASAYGATFPHLSAQLEVWGVSGALIGLNTAMPALGWIAGSLALPRIQMHAETRTIAVVSLVMAAITWGAFALIQDFVAWTFLRLIFGGSLGLFFRIVEFGLNAVADPDVRGKIISRYNVYFGIGIAMGATIQPSVSSISCGSYTFVSTLIIIAAFPLYKWRIDARSHIISPSMEIWRTVILATPLPLILGFCYGFLEDIPASLFSIYALRNGLGSFAAAYTLTAAALGSIVFPLFFGYCVDRHGVRPWLFVSPMGVIASIACLPFSIKYPELFLIIIFIFSGFVTTFYTTALIIFGHQWKNNGLSIANGAFGAAYAVGGIVGPLVNGIAMDTPKSIGLVASAQLISLFVIVVAFRDRAKCFSR